MEVELSKFRYYIENYFVLSVNISVRCGSSDFQKFSHTENFFWVELTFASSYCKTGLLSHLGSNICKTQDQSHSDTTPLFTGHGEKFQGEK